MNVNFGKDSKPATEVAPPTAEPVAKAPESQLPAVQQPQPVSKPGLMLGDHIPDFSEIIMPRVNIAQNIGKIKEKFPVGTLVLNQQVILFLPPLTTPQGTSPATPPATITVLGFRPTVYCEKVPGGGKGLTVKTPEAVVKAGGTLDYQEWDLKKGSGMKRFEYLADALVLIKRPEGTKDEALFSYEVEGARYALALWALRGVCYTAAAKRVFFTHRAIGCLRQEGYPSWSYSVSTREETYPGGNKAWIPVCIPNAKNSPAVLDFVKTVLTAPTGGSAE